MNFSSVLLHSNFSLWSGTLESNSLHQIPISYFWLCFCGSPPPCGAATQRGPWPPHSWGFYITHNDASQSVALLWTSDQLVTETSIWQHTTLTTDKHPCLQWDSNPRSLQASGHRPTPAALLLGSELLWLVCAVLGYLRVQILEMVEYWRIAMQCINPYEMYNP